jgi:hypothetical protein
MNQNELLEKCLNEFKMFDRCKFDTYGLITQGCIILMDLDRLWNSIDGRRYSDVDIYHSLYTHIKDAGAHIERLMFEYPKCSLIAEHMLLKEINELYNVLLNIKDRYFRED